MGHPIHRIKAFEIAGPYRLRIEFGDGMVRTIDFRPILEGQVHTLVWPNGADFDPARLHDWPEHEAGLLALAERWAAATGSGTKAG